MQFITPMPARFRQPKAAHYKLEDGFITPDAQEVVEMSVGNDELLKDYLALIGDYVQYAPLVLSQGQWMPPQNERAKYEKQIAFMAERLLEFCNKWGLFKLINDQAYPIYTRIDSNGVTIVCSTPVSWVVYDDPFDPLDGGAMIRTHAQYMSRFRLPEEPLSESEVSKRYSESVMDILTDPRIRAVAQYIDNVTSGRPAYMPSERITLLLENGSARPGATSLNEYCQVLYMIDEMKGRDRVFEMCRHCLRPFLTNSKGRVYCSDACMRNERNRQYRIRKGMKENAQQKGEQ